MVYHDGLVRRMCLMHYWVKDPIDFCRASWFIVLLKHSIYLLICLVDLYISENGVLKNPSIIVGWSISLSNSFFVSCIVRLFWGAYMFTIVSFLMDWPFYHKISFFFLTTPFALKSIVSDECRHSSSHVTMCMLCLFSFIFQFISVFESKLCFF